MKARQVVVTAHIGAAQGRKGREDSADDSAVLVVGRRRLPVGGRGRKKSVVGRLEVPVMVIMTMMPAF